MYIHIVTWNFYSPEIFCLQSCQPKPLVVLLCKSLADSGLSRKPSHFLEKITWSLISNNWLNDLFLGDNEFPIFLLLRTTTHTNTVWKWREFTLTHGWPKFRESNVFTEVVTFWKITEQLSRNFCQKRVRANCCSCPRTWETEREPF